MAEGELPRIGFLGAGKMATALAHAWLAAKLILPKRGIASDPSPAARQAFTEKTGIEVCTDNAEVVGGSDLLVIAVKPQSVSELLSEIRPFVTERHLIVS